MALGTPTGKGNVPQALSFDGEGWLWVTSYYDDQVVAFAPDQLARSGAPKPRVRWDLPGGSGPIGVTVDDREQVWVAEALADMIVSFPAGAKDGRTPQPMAAISGGQLVMPHGITFASDAAWIPCYNDTVLRYGLDRIGRTFGGEPDLVLA